MYPPLAREILFVPLAITWLALPLSGCQPSAPLVSVVGMHPADQASGAEPDSRITATLSDTIDTLPPAAFVLSDGDAIVAANVSVDAGKQMVSLIPERPLALSTSYTATLNLPGADEGGATVAPIVWSFTTRDVTAWQFVDGDGLNWSRDWDTYFPQLTVLGEKLYAAWREMSYRRGPMQLRVAVYNGDDTTPAWRFVDDNTQTGGINWDRNRHGFAIQITAFNGKLYAIWEENSPTVSQIRVAVYNGNDDKPAWSFVDGDEPTGLNHDPKFLASYPQLTVFDGRLYAIWSEQNGDARQIRVAVYNGRDDVPAWRFVDGDTTNGINYNAARSGFHPQFTAFGTKLVAAWEEHNGTAQQIRVAVYNGNDQAPVWSFSDGGSVNNGINHVASKNAAYPELTVYDSRLYATWTERNAEENSQVRVGVYNGDDRAPAWAFVDGDRASGLNRNPDSMAYEPQLTVFGTRLYVTWYEGDHKGRGQIRVAVYDGDENAPRWAFADGGGKKGINKNTRRSALDPQLTVFNSQLYITWKELIGRRGQRVHVAVGR